MALTIAKSAGWRNLSIRVGFSAEMAARNAARTKHAAIQKKIDRVAYSELKPTERLFDKDQTLSQFSAKVILANPSGIKPTLLNPHGL